MFSTFLSFLLYVIQSFKPMDGVFSIFKLYVGLAFSISLCMLTIRNEYKLPKIKIVNTVASVTLESYIVQFICRDAYSVVGFPTNIICHTISTIAVAMCLHYLAGKVHILIENKLIVKRMR